MGRVARRITSQAASAARAIPARAMSTRRVRSTSRTSSVSETWPGDLHRAAVAQRRGDHAVVLAVDGDVAVVLDDARPDAIGAVLRVDRQRRLARQRVGDVAVAVDGLLRRRRTRRRDRGDRRRRVAARRRSRRRGPRRLVARCSLARSRRNLSVSSRSVLRALTCAAYAPPTTATATITATTTVRRVRRLTLRSGRVPDSPHRVDQARLARLFGLAAQVADVDVERLRRRLEVVAPDALVDLFAGEHDAGVVEEELEQVELGLGELELTVAAPRLTARGIERRGRRRAAPRRCPDMLVRRSSARRRASSSSSANGFTR